MKTNSIKVVGFIAVTIVVGIFFVFDKSIGFFLISKYSSLVNGREIIAGDLAIKIPDPWYITEREKNKVKLSRIPSEADNIVVGIVEFGNMENFLSDVPSIRDKIQNNQLLPNVRIGKHAAYKFTFEKACTNKEGTCYHIKLLVPDMSLNITISNFNENQTGAVDEIIDAISKYQKRN